MPFALCMLLMGTHCTRHYLLPALQGEAGGAEPHQEAGLYQEQPSHSRRAPRGERPRMDRDQRPEGAVRERGPVNAGATRVARCCFLWSARGMQQVQNRDVCRGVPMLSCRNFTT